MRTAVMADKRKKERETERGYKERSLRVALRLLDGADPPPPQGILPVGQDPVVHQPVLVPPCELPRRLVHGILASPASDPRDEKITAQPRGELRSHEVRGDDDRLKQVNGHLPLVPLEPPNKREVKVRTTDDVAVGYPCSAPFLFQHGWDLQHPLGGH